MVSNSYFFEYDQLINFSLQNEWKSLENNFNLGSNVSRGIDIVYTWVNGSDPLHKDAVMRAKRELSGEEGDKQTKKKRLFNLLFSFSEIIKYKFHLIWFLNI